MKGRGARRAWMLAALGIAACRGEPSAAPASGAPGGASAQPTALPVRAPARPASARAADPRWRLALGEDPVERARLAEAEGASGLLDALDDGGEIADVALLALPYADDADLALGPLAERALAAPPATAGPLVRALLEIAGRPARPREPLDPEGARAAGAALITLARRVQLPAEVRAHAVSGARALAERGYADPAAIPADLDPRP